MTYVDVMPAGDLNPRKTRDQHRANELERNAGSTPRHRNTDESVMEDKWLGKRKIKAGQQSPRSTQGGKKVNPANKQRKRVESAAT